MSRTRVELESKNNQKTAEVIEDILNSSRYDLVEKNGEKYWQQGIGVTASPKFIKYYFENDKLILEAWVNNFGKESNLDGFVGALPKKQCKSVLDKIKNAVEKSNQEITNNKNISTTSIDNANDSSTNDVQSFNDDAFNFINQKSNNNNLDNDKKLLEDAFNNIKQDNGGFINNNAESNVNINKNTENTVNISNEKPRNSSNAIIPRKYRGSMLQNIGEIIIAIIYIIGASQGYMVLRFTDSGTALIIVALIILLHGTLSLISNLQDN